MAYTAAEYFLSFIKGSASVHDHPALRPVALASVVQAGETVDKLESVLWLTLTSAHERHEHGHTRLINQRIHHLEAWKCQQSVGCNIIR